MQIKKNVHHLVEGAMIAALYIVLTYAQELLIPGTATMAVQFRLSEVLCILALFTPSAIWGLTAGTFVSNLLTIGALPLDIIFGTFATFVAVSLIYQLRNIRWFGLPVISAMIPALVNGIIIGLELEIFLVLGPFNFVSFLLLGGSVALGELLVCVVLGLPFFKLIEKTALFDKLNKRL